MNLLENIIKDYNITLRSRSGYCDLPRINQYFATLKISKYGDTGSGFSFNEQSAKEKAVFESIERTCLFHDNNDKKSFFQNTRKNLEKNNIEQIFHYFSENQIKKNPKKLQVSLDNKFICSYVTEYGKDTKIPLPNQFIYLNSGSREKVLINPISTGAAAGKTVKDAILRGIFEVIERDAFTINYLTNTYGQLIDVAENKKLENIKKYYNKYNLNLYLINLPTDLGIYTIMAFIIDTTKLGVPLSVGMKTGLNPVNTVIKAIEEAHMSITSSRNEMLNLDEKLKNINPLQISTIRDRELYWLNYDNLKYINKWIKNKNIVNINKMKNLSQGNIENDLNYVIQILHSHNHKIYYINIKKKMFNKYKFAVVKVIIPTLQPFYLKERYKYLGLNRLYQVPVDLGYYKNQLQENELNNIPHFFL